MQLQNKLKLKLGVLGAEMRKSGDAVTKQAETKAGCPWC